jgi:hypothetical protein
VTKSRNPTLFPSKPVRVSTSFQVRLVAQLKPFVDPKTAPPRPPTHSSIPALLQSLQNEWDAIVLEIFALKQQYNSTRQELSYALYSQDAATRVVARLIRERDAARESVFSYIPIVKISIIRFIGLSLTFKQVWE